MSSFDVKLLCVGIGAVVASIVFGLVWYFSSKKVTQPQVAQPTQADQQAIAQVTQALLDRAKAEAQSEEDMKKIQDIEKIPDPSEKLKQLADALKGV